MGSKRYMDGQLLDKKELNDRVSEFTIKLEENLVHTPGQYVKLQTLVNGNLKKADYTIISSNKNKETISVAIDNHPNSTVGHQFHSMEVGSPVSYRGPYGRFVVDKDAESIRFFARDIGIVSALGNLLYLSENNYTGTIKLYYFISKKFDSIYHDKLQEFQEQLQLDVETFTQEKFGKSFVKKGKIKKKQIKQLFPGLEESSIYISGASKFVKGIKKKLIKSGTEKEMIFTEKFG